MCNFSQIRKNSPSTTLCSEVGWVCLNVHERMWMMTNMRYHRKKASPSWTPTSSNKAQQHPYPHFHPFVDFGAPPNHGGQHTSRSLTFCEHVKRPLLSRPDVNRGRSSNGGVFFSLVHQAEKKTLGWFFCVYQMYGLADQLSLSNCYLHVMLKIHAKDGCWDRWTDSPLETIVQML